VEVKTFGAWQSHSLEWLNSDTLIWIDGYDVGPMHTINVDTLVETDLGINGQNPYVGNIYESPADGTWWNDSWNYRKQATITNNVETTLYNYSVMITLDTAELISQGKMQSDCGDIRIIENDQEINYGITNPNSISTEIYFIANDLNDGNNTDIYIYYGNPDANNGFVENWKDAFYIWHDDFDTDRGWDNCPGNAQPGTVTVDTVNSWLYASFGPYTDYHVCPNDGSSFPMDGRVGFKAETRIMAENDYLCQLQVGLKNSSYTAGVPIIDFRPGHNDYSVLWDSDVPKTLDDDVWYDAYAVYNRLTGQWYGEFANDGIRAGIRTPQVDDDFSRIYLDICNGINMYLDYLYLRYFIEPEPNYALGAEQIYGPHDQCADAIAVEVNEPYNGSTEYATGTDISSCAYEDNNDVWHSLTARYSADYTISLCGSAFDTTLAVFDDCSGTELACNDDTGPDVCDHKWQSQLTIALEKGSTYYIRIAGWNGETGDYTLTVFGPQCTGPLAMDFNDDCKVDFQDFAIFSQSWLECNLEPPDVCWQ
jgi:hypothetical protein